MARPLIRSIITAVGLGIFYLMAWPIPVDPVAWQAPENPGYTGVFEANTALKSLDRIDIGPHHGPEDVAIGPDGSLFVAVEGGKIIRVDPAGGWEIYAETGGRPLGIEMDIGGNLLIADAYMGLVRITAQRQFQILADITSDGAPIRYANNLDITPDGSIYFSDASTKFGAQERGGTLAASLLDIMEHGGHGRLLKFDPVARTAVVVQDGFNFANGVAVDPGGQFVLVAETSAYRIQRVWIDGPKKGTTETLIDNLPGFPDNLNRAPDGTFWVGLVSPRSDVLDSMSGRPFIRRVVQRLPPFMRPKEQHYGFVVRFDRDGQILETLQNPDGTYPLTTGAVEGPGGNLFVTSLRAGYLGQLTR